MKTFLTFLFALVTSFAFAQQRVIPLYAGKAPGSENWNWQEQASPSGNAQATSVYNVVSPSLTVYPASGPVNTGTAIIIAPGGGLLGLSISSEGTEVAEWLSKRGITAFVLKYRLVHTTDPVKEFMAALAVPGKIELLIRPVAPLAMQDGLAAVAYVRQHAATYGVKPTRIGFMGFSAGGGVALSVAYNATDENRPNFLAPIYAWDKNVLGAAVPQQQMPAFIAVAADDDLGLAPFNLAVYTKWKAAQQLAELLVFQNGGHGFGMQQQGKLSDHWIDRFGEWLRNNKLL